MGYRGLDKPVYDGLKAIRRQGLNGLIERFDGLSIVILEALTPKPQIIKAICRQIDKPYIPISPIAPYHRFEGLSRALKTREYKRHTNIPSNRQTISSGYKGLVNM